MPAKTPEGRKLTAQRAASARWGLPLETIQSWDPKERARLRGARWRERQREELVEYYRQYRDSHPELKEYHAKYFRENGARPLTAEDRAKRKVRDGANREKLNADRREWVKNNPERARQIEKRTRTKNRENKRKQDAAYRRANPEIYKAAVAHAKAAKPELYRDITLNSVSVRRARKKQSAAEPVSVKAIRARDNFRCHLCGSPAERPNLSLDHLIPIARGGAHAEWNLMVAHLDCNKRRRTTQIIFPETKDAAIAYILACNIGERLA